MNALQPRSHQRERASPRPVSFGEWAERRTRPVGVTLLPCCGRGSATLLTAADCRESDSRLSRTRREAEASLGPLPPRRLCRACLQHVFGMSSDNTILQTTHVFRPCISSDNANPLTTHVFRPCISSDNANPQTTHVFRQCKSSDNTILQTTQQTTHNKTDTSLTSIRLTSITPGPDSFSASLISVAASASPSASMIAA